MDLITLLTGICLILLGIAQIRRPDAFWSLEHYFTVEGGAPTKSYRVLRRICGGICIAGGVFALSLLLF